ncbi:MAG TPA: aminotransferase class IV [Bacteroidota bacterium]|nr:aminotransferase class IV [Bacteroidota bacterium]
MCHLFEVVKVFQKNFFNLDYHSYRFNHTREYLFNQDPVDLKDIISIPPEIDNGLYKCRIIYAQKIEKIEFIPYKKRKINSLRFIENDEIDYEYKYLNKECLEKMFLQKGKADDILIIKNKLLTDTSFSNIALFDGIKWFTPTLPLLKGTKRQSLLDRKEIFEDEIKISELKLFKKVALINAMLDIGEIEFDVENIIR